MTLCEGYTILSFFCQAQARLQYVGYTETRNAREPTHRHYSCPQRIRLTYTVVEERKDKPQKRFAEFSLEPEVTFLCWDLDPNAPFGEVLLS